jgi:hypothetical protein
MKTYESTSSSPVTTVVTVLVAGWFFLAAGAIVADAVNPVAGATAADQVAVQDTAGRKLV